MKKVLEGRQARLARKGEIYRSNKKVRRVGDEEVGK